MTHPPWEAEQFRRDGYATVDWIADYLGRVGDLPVVSSVAPGEIRGRLPASPPDAPEAFAEVLRDLDEVLLPGITHWNHPRFFAYFAISGSEPGILAELLIAALNVNAALWRMSPSATELEELATSWLAQLLGLGPGWHGHIEDTASVGAIVALATARELAPDRPFVVCSEHAHSSIDRACRLLGLQPRKVPSDSTYRLDPEQLDLSGACAAVATLGTTSTGAVDPLREIGERCRDAGVWLHVDGAYGGSAMICPELRHHIAGIELVDSMVVNPHKWLFVPLDCSAFFTRRPEAVRAAFSLIPEYLRTDDEDVLDLHDYGPALGRRFRALKLWTVMRCFGRAGLEARIREHMGFARLFAERVEADDSFELAAPVGFSLVCFRFRGSDDANEEIMRRVNASGEAYLSHTKLENRLVLRLAVGNLRTTAEDIERTWACVKRAVLG